ncbi:hypothetical protein KIN20_024863 [Parelaphostrongylus tenuis]|uniref:Uncharacterized protein n=1 Tax=Parelaphostrongylus tenuis TaxID=148309 RepID=A0AAD5NBG8_PARTN|nr:hypothetical protein KIN20_024863 [Parelaphostrongylus tenuis]
MDSDVEEDVTVESGEELEGPANCQLSPNLCSCGAYDKIMSATNLLRKRIVEAVNSELDQYEQPLEVLLGSSKQGFAHSQEDQATIGSAQATYDGSGSTPQIDSQSQVSESNPSQSSPAHAIVNDILVNASLLLLSKLK